MYRRSRYVHSPDRFRFVYPYIGTKSFLRKLKFHYMEQHAKDKYVKFIVSPDEPGIEAEHNIQLGMLSNNLSFYITYIAVSSGRQ